MFSYFADKELMENKTIIIIRDCNILHLKDIWLMHSNLFKASKGINSCYSFQLLFWIFSFFFDCITKCYSLTFKTSNARLIREILYVTICFLNIFFLTISCHFTSHKVSF